MNQPRIQSVPVTLTKTSTGYSATTPLTQLGREGKILQVRVREDVTLDEMSVGDFIIANATTIGAATPEEDIVYRDVGTSYTGSATVLSLNDNVAADGGAPYKVVTAGDLGVAINVTTAAGGGASTSVDAVIDAEVWG